MIMGQVLSGLAQMPALSEADDVLARIPATINTVTFHETATELLSNWSRVAMPDARVWAERLRLVNPIPVPCPIWTYGDIAPRIRQGIIELQQKQALDLLRFCEIAVAVFPKHAFDFLATVDGVAIGLQAFLEKVNDEYFPTYYMPPGHLKEDGFGSILEGIHAQAIGFYAGEDYSAWVDPIQVLLLLDALDADRIVGWEDEDEVQSAMDLHTEELNILAGIRIPNVDKFQPHKVLQLLEGDAGIVDTPFEHLPKLWRYTINETPYLLANHHPDEFEELMGQMDDQLPQWTLDEVEAIAKQYREAKAYCELGGTVIDYVCEQKEGKHGTYYGSDPELMKEMGALLQKYIDMSVEVDDE